MHLPPEIGNFIAEYAEGVDLATLRKAAAGLSKAYRSGVPAHELVTAAKDRTAAYLVTHYPATYGAAVTALRETARCLGDARVESVCDLGAGAGATARAALAVWPEIREITLVETDATFSAIARKLLPVAGLRQIDMRRMEVEAFDLVTAGYSLGELSQSDAAALVLRVWQSAQVAFVVIEPGTPAAFRRLLILRDLLLREGATIAAPCPNGLPCPLIDPDWCHFGARVERSALHRRVKEGSLSYEDEKFCYLAVTKQNVSPAEGRILRRPSHEPGLISLAVCREGRADKLRVGRRAREEYRAARKAEWGGAWTRL